MCQKPFRIPYIQCMSQHVVGNAYYRHHMIIICQKGQIQPPIIFTTLCLFLPLKSGWRQKPRLLAKSPTLAARRHACTSIAETGPPEQTLGHYQIFILFADQVKFLAVTLHSRLAPHNVSLRDECIRRSSALKMIFLTSSCGE